jgi:hypothetical protein
MLARAETVAVEKHRDEDDAAPCRARMEVRSISPGCQGGNGLLKLEVEGGS